MITEEWEEVYKLIDNLFDAVVYELRTVGVFSLYLADLVERLAGEIDYAEENTYEEYEMYEPPLCDCGRRHWHGGPDGYECGF